MKINSDIFLNNINTNFDDINIIFFYGANVGLVELLYKKTLSILKININDPFSVSSIDGEGFKENPSKLIDNINTLNVFSEKRYILLNLINVSITKNIESIILEATKEENNNFLLLIKSGNLKQSIFLKHFQNKKNSILVPCYEEKSEKINDIISNLFSKHKLNFRDNFINNLAMKFNSDSLTNKMEIDKIDTFLTNNKNVTEEMIYTLISKNEDFNLNKVIEYCTKGNSGDALTYFDNVYENQSTSITLIRMFVSHFKLIEKILLLVKKNKNLVYVIDNIRPPIFFKKKGFIIFQCKIWNLKLINTLLTRLIDLELKCKLNHLAERTLLSQFILSTSVLARNRIKS